MKYIGYCVLLLLTVEASRSNEDKNYSTGVQPSRTSSKNEKTDVRTYRYSDICRLENELPYTRENIRVKCCVYVTMQFSKYWTKNEYYLSTYLETLQTWNCSQFQKECVEQQYGFTPFSSMMYMRFCNHTELRRRCWASLSSLHLPGNILELHEIFLSGSVINATHVRNPEEWNKMMAATANLHMTVGYDTFKNPCIQVSMYDYSGYGFYHEIKNMFLPFCGFVWCGISSDALDEDSVSDWSCMPDR